MCFNLSLTKFTEYLEKRYQAKMLPEIIFSPFYHISAYSHPKIPLITSENPENFDLLSWGLIPFWIKSKKDAKEISNKTINAKSETIFEKPSFRNSIKRKRCIIPADGFFEFHTFNGKKYPFYIKLKTGESFSLGGVWDTWEDPEEKKSYKTFSIITKEADDLLSIIHNDKKRMPLILNREDEKKWISEIAEADIHNILKKSFKEKLEAYPVSRLITSRTSSSDTPAVIERFDYPELNINLP